MLTESVIVTFEGARANYVNLWAASTGVTHPREAHIVYGCGGERSILASYGYATDDVLPNPYDEITGTPWNG